MPMRLGRNEPYTKVGELPKMRREIIQQGRQAVRAGRNAYVQVSIALKEGTPERVPGFKERKTCEVK